MATFFKTKSTAPTTGPAPIGTWQRGNSLALQQSISALFYGNAEFDSWDNDLLPMQRLQAQTVPAMQGIENIVVGTLAPLSLQSLNAAGDPIPTQPAWINRCDYASQNPYLRAARTVTDLLYSGISCWTKDAIDGRGYPVSMSHVPLAPEQWDYTGRFWAFAEFGQGVIIDNQIVPFNQVVIFESPFRGVLNVGARALRTALAIERTINYRAHTAAPTQALRNLGDGSTEPTEDELKDAIQAYSKARRSPNGPTVYIPGGYALEEHKDDPDNWLLPARNAVGQDLAKMTSVPAALNEGTSAIDSLTYTTSLGEQARWQDFGIKTYTAPIEARLSMADVTPSTQTVRFDLTPLKGEAPSPITAKGQPLAPNTSAEEPNSHE